MRDKCQEQLQNVNLPALNWFPVDTTQVILSSAELWTTQSLEPILTPFWQLASPKPLPFMVTRVELRPLFGIIDVTSGVLHFQNEKLKKDELFGNAGSEEEHSGIALVTPDWQSGELEAVGFTADKL